MSIEVPDSKIAAEDQLTKGIDRNSNKPVYAQLAEIIHQQILAGVFAPGERLPSEAMLVEGYNVSPMTVRRAINYLAAQDVITTAQGKGTFVKSVELEDAAFYLRDISAIFGDDQETTIKVIEARFVVADARIARKLQVCPGEKVIFMRRLLSIEDSPAFYHRGYLVNDPRRPIVEAELEVADLQGIFRGSGSELIKNGEVFLESTALNAEELGLLRLPGGAHGMMLEHIFYDFEDKPLSWGWFVCHNRRLRLHAWVGLQISEGVRDERTR